MCVMQLTIKNCQVLKVGNEYLTCKLFVEENVHISQRKLPKKYFGISSETQLSYQHQYRKTYSDTKL